MSGQLADTPQVPPDIAQLAPESLTKLAASQPLAFGCSEILLPGFLSISPGLLESTTSLLVEAERVNENETRAKRNYALTQ